MRNRINDISGIYKITSLVNGKVYVGQAAHIPARKAEHLRSLYKGDHHSKYLQRHYDKYGVDDLVFETIELCDTTHLTEREDYWMKMFPCAFNMCKAANSMLGYKHDAAFKAKVGKRVTGDGNPMKNEETKKKMSELMTGREFSAESKQRMSAGAKKRYEDKEEREKLSKALKGRFTGEESNFYGRHLLGKDNPNFGKHLSKEAKEKLSLANKGKCLGENNPMKRADVKEKHLEVMQSLEYRQNMSKVMKENRSSVEARQKMKDAAKLGWERRRLKLLNV